MPWEPGTSKWNQFQEVREEIVSDNDDDTQFTTDSNHFRKQKQALKRYDSLINWRLNDTWGKISTPPLVISSEIYKGRVILPKALVLKNYSRKSYYILLPCVLYCIHFYRTTACVCRTSKNCKSLILQDKCNIEIFLSPVTSPPVFEP